MSTNKDGSRRAGNTPGTLTPHSEDTGRGLAPMMPPNHLNRHARLNDERRLTTARAVLTEAQGEAGWATLTDGAKVMYAVGLLICDDAGIIKKDALEVAMADPQIIATAMALLFETGAQ